MRVHVFVCCECLEIEGNEIGALLWDAILCCWRFACCWSKSPMRDLSIREMLKLSPTKGKENIINN